MWNNWQSVIIAITILLSVSITSAQTGIIDICPDADIQARPAVFEPSGIILTSFDSTSLWVYDIARDTRYPLPETRPCTSNCHLSPDAQWMIYLDPQTFVFSKMRLNGTQRTPLVSDAADVRWWTQDTLLIWTTDQSAYLRPEADQLAEGQFLPTNGVVIVQPSGTYAVQIDDSEQGFARYLVNLENDDQSPILLSDDRTYFNATAWSPNGEFLAYVGSGEFDETDGVAGGEIFLMSPSDTTSQQLTQLTDNYGSTRINGYAPNDLSWSPDSTKLAFWVMALTGSDPAINTSSSVIHVVDIISGETRRYCGFSATEHTPETPRIVWSPDGSHIAFAGNIPGDDKGALLLAMNVETGIFTELSNGMFPVYGIPQLNAWGIVP